MQVLEMIAPPYSPDFISLMLPIVQNKEITETLRTSNGEDDVTQFLSELFHLFFLILISFLSIQTIDHCIFGSFQKVLEHPYMYFYESCFLI